MEESSNKQRKKKIEVRGAGVGGILILSGALVAAALIATFTHITNKRKPNSKTPQKPPKFKERNCSGSSREGSEGLLSVLHPSSSVESHRCCRSRIEHGESRIESTQIGLFDSVEIETHVMEERSVLEVNEEDPDLDIVSDKSQTDSLWTSNDDVISKRKGFSSLDIDVSLIDEENINREDHVEDSLYVNALVVVQENPSLQIEEEEDDDDDDDDGDDEIEGEEGSEGTGDSSMESNTEPIWPAESMEDGSLELKETKTQVQILAEKIDEVDIKPVEEEGEIESMRIFESQEKKTGFMMVRSRFWVWSMFAVGLLFVLLSHVMTFSFKNIK